MEKTFWILGCGRCGTTYFSNLLSQTGVVGQVTERFHTLEGISKGSFIQNPIKIAKVLRNHFNAIFSNKDKNLIESLIPGIRYILLSRDLKDVAVSLYLSKATKCWGVRNQRDINEYLGRQIKLDEQAVISTYLECCKDYADWMEYLKGSEFIIIQFNDLIKDAQAEVIRALQFLEIAIPETLPERDDTYIWPMPKHPLKDKINYILEKYKDSKIYTL